MHRSTIRLAAVFTVATLALAACGDDSQEPTASADTEAPSSDATLPEGEPVSGDPVVIGFVNSEGGAFSVPEMRVGSEVAEAVRQRATSAASPADPSRSSVVPPTAPRRPPSTVPTSWSRKASRPCTSAPISAPTPWCPCSKDAGIPIIGHVQLGIAGMFDDNSYYFGSAALAYGVAALQFYADQGAETITWFFPDVPTSRGFTDTVLTPAATEMGIEYKSIYYDAASPNLPVLAATAVIGAPDVSGALAATDGQCAEMISALRGAGYQGDILAASCVGLHDAVGDDAVGVHTDSDHWNPGDIESAPAAKQEDLELYAAAMRAAGEDDLIDGNAVITFADTHQPRRRSCRRSTARSTEPRVTKALRATVDFEASPVRRSPAITPSSRATPHAPRGCSSSRCRRTGPSRR